MSVIRRPDVLGRTTRQRVVGVTAALSSAAVESVAVGTWFVLVSEFWTQAAAMVGLAILLAGSIGRIRIFGAATDGRRRPVRPAWLVAAVGSATWWIVWLLVAETLGGPLGAAVAAVWLGAALTLQFHAERRCWSVTCVRGGIETAAVPAAVLAVGATALLASTWIGDWSLFAVPFTGAGRTVVVEAGAVTLGVVAFGVSSALAHRFRFRWTLSG